jgi:tRNA-dihydrouridine synthase
MADWHEIARVVALRDTKAPATKIIGNGDLTRANSDEKLASGVDGLMFGRGVFADLGVFRREGYRPYSSWTEGEKIALMERHLTDHFRAWASTKDYHQLKKFFKNYTVGFEGCLILREMLMQTNTTFEALEVLHTWRTRLR